MKRDYSLLLILLVLAIAVLASSCTVVYHKTDRFTGQHGCYAGSKHHKIHKHHKKH